MSDFGTREAALRSEIDKVRRSFGFTQHQDEFLSMVQVESDWLGDDVSLKNRQAELHKELLRLQVRGISVVQSWE